jgi:hypothetical protein
MAHRRMSDPELRTRQHAGLRKPHIVPFANLIEDLVETAGQGWVPTSHPRTAV